MKKKIIQVVNLEIDSISLDTERYIYYAEELISELGEFEENLEIDFQNEIIDLEAIVAEGNEIIDQIDNLENEKPRNYSYNNEEKIIENMFDGLK